MKIRTTLDYDIEIDKDNNKYCSYEGESGYYGEFYYVAHNCPMLDVNWKYCRLFKNKL